MFPGLVKQEAKGRSRCDGGVGHHQAAAGGAGRDESQQVCLYFGKAWLEKLGKKRTCNVEMPGDGVLILKQQ